MREQLAVEAREALGADIRGLCPLDVDRAPRPQLPGDELLRPLPQATRRCAERCACCVWSAICCKSG